MAPPKYAFLAPKTIANMGPLLQTNAAMTQPSLINVTMADLPSTDATMADLPSTNATMADLPPTNPTMTDRSYAFTRDEVTLILELCNSAKEPKPTYNDIGYHSYLARELHQITLPKLQDAKTEAEIEQAINKRVTDRHRVEKVTAKLATTTSTVNAKVRTAEASLRKFYVKRVKAPEEAEKLLAETEKAVEDMEKDFVGAEKRKIDKISK